LNDSHRFNLAADSLGSEEIDAAIAVLRAGRYTMGATVREFEAKLADWIGVRNAVMVNSGSSANLLLVDSLLRRLNPADAPLQAGDEVIVPALAWPTTVWPIVQLGLVPVYVDVDPDTLAIDLESAESALSPRTKAMFLIQALGRACPMAAYVAFCRTHGLTLIEDCCESFGAFDQGRHVGLFGRGGTLSHFYSHHLTCIEGGSIITDDDRLADDLRSMRAHGWIRERTDRQRQIDLHPEFDPRFLFLLPGYNVRPIEIEAAVGLVQLAKMDHLMEARENLARQVREWTGRHTPWMTMIGSDSIGAPGGRRQGRSHSWMMIAFLLADDSPLSLQEVKTIFETSGVETRSIIAGNLARHPAAKYGPHRIAGELPVADRLLTHGFMIGCHPNPSPQSVERVRQAFLSLAR
jgi:CDP-4-dehydro-6-deoxyglucose reductase, E1